VKRRNAELTLRRALLEQAIHQYLLHAQASGRHGRALFAEAAHWIWADDEDAWPYSFVRVCDVLSLDVAAARVAIEDGRLRGRLPDQRARGATHGDTMILPTTTRLRSLVKPATLR